MRWVNATMRKDHPPGTIAVVSADLARYPKTFVSLWHLDLPPGTTAIPDGAELLWKPGVNIAGNLNDIVRQAKGEWIFFMGDDHDFPTNIVMQLLSHEVDIVVPLVPTRTPVYTSVVFALMPHADVKHPNIHERLERIPMGWLRHCRGDLIHSYEGRDLVAGTAGMLVRKRVFTTIEEPWFAIGQLRPDSLQEDIYFCLKARAAGFKVHVDTGAFMGHFQVVSVRPAADPEKNGSPIVMELAPGVSIGVPAQICK